jgi:hypothetical protein
VVDYAPDLFQEFPVRTDRVAERLGITIRWSEASRGRAQIERFTLHSYAQFRIQLSRDIPLSVRRFAIAHEIGHALLLSAHPGLATSLTTRDRELFADTFAAALVLPPSAKPMLSLRYRSIDTPIELLRFVGELGLTPAAFFRIATRDPLWTAGSALIWVRVKNAVNRHTGRDQKLRIVAAIYDTERFFVPLNIGLRRLFDDEWLRFVEEGRLIECRAAAVPITLVNKLTKPKFVTSRMQANLTGVKLAPSYHDQEPYFIIGIDLSSDTLERKNDGEAGLQLELPLTAAN